mmetsp:Transcript_21664/g.44287  ORF Transcript_21664/g.44287 Transcript_21664/m.44287 type:complete len:85 (-) Transcript_21664:28-282(-)
MVLESFFGQMGNWFLIESEYVRSISTDIAKMRLFHISRATQYLRRGGNQWSRQYASLSNWLFWLHNYDHHIGKNWLRVVGREKQ